MAFLTKPWNSSLRFLYAASTKIGILISSSTTKESFVTGLFLVSVPSWALCRKGKSSGRLTGVNDEAFLEGPREIKTRHYSSTHSRKDLLAELAASLVELKALFLEASLASDTPSLEKLSSKDHRRERNSEHHQHDEKRKPNGVNAYSSKWNK